MNNEFFNGRVKCPHTFRVENGEAKQHGCWSECSYFVKIQDDGRGYCNFENSTLASTLFESLTNLVNELQKITGRK